MGIPLTERHQIEREYHDQASMHARTDFYAWGALDAADEFAYSLIGRPQGRVLLDLGCGDGSNALRFAQAGARVIAIDLSGGMVDVTRSRTSAAGYGALVYAQQMSAEYLGFADATFDYVFGHSVLHHTDLRISREEILRVLKPGGRAVFLEPLDHNPLLNLFRRLTPWRRTPTEKPLSLDDIRFFAEPFSSSAHTEFYLLALAAFALVPLRNRTLFRAVLRALVAADRALFRALPSLGRYAWVTVLELRR